MLVYELRNKQNKIIVNSCNLQDIINFLTAKKYKINCIEDIFKIKKYSLNIINESLRA